MYGYFMKTNKMDILLGIIIGLSASLISAIASVFSGEIIVGIAVSIAFVMLCYIIILIVEYYNCINYKTKNT